MSPSAVEKHVFLQPIKKDLGHLNVASSAVMQSYFVCSVQNPSGSSTLLCVTRGAWRTNANVNVERIWKSFVSGIFHLVSQIYLHLFPSIFLTWQIMRAMWMAPKTLTSRRFSQQGGLVLGLRKEEYVQCIYAPGSIPESCSILQPLAFPVSLLYITPFPSSFR